MARQRTLKVVYGVPGKNKGGTRTLGVRMPAGRIEANNVQELLCGAGLEAVLTADPLAAKDVDGRAVRFHRRMLTL